MNVYQHDAFEAAVDRAESAVAIDDHGATLTYGALEERANRIARVLRSAGVNPNARVCLLTGKNANAYAALLGVLKAGGCWVPLSTAFPQERLRKLVASLRPAVVVVEPGTLDIARALRDEVGAQAWPILLLGGEVADKDVIDERDVCARPSERVRAPDASPDDLAYIIFTSGSTGVPKGVMVLHRNTSQFLNLCPDFFEIERGARFAHFSELTFDPSIFDLFHCWQSGGTLVPFNRRRYRINPGRFLVEQKVNVLFTVPSVLVTIRDAGFFGNADLASLQHLLLTGEAVPPALVRAWYDSYPQSCVYNMYGTTETAIVSHWLKVPAEIGETDQMPVGHALPGMRVMLMDGDRLVEDGQIGESVVYGSQLSAGYWASTYQTQAAFCRHPLDADLPQTVYRTGDMLRREHDGLFYFEGRVDTQVKIRGHRVELGEIESVLRLHEAVRDAVVVDVKGEGGYDHRIVAFIRAQENAAADDLGSYLSAKLPNYMVPSRIITLSADFPRNLNGKVDRAELRRQASESLHPEAQA